MSYGCYLVDPVSKEVLTTDTPHQIRGACYALGGTTEMYLSVTYNYSSWYYKDGVFPTRDGKSIGFNSLHGMSGAESIPVLTNAIKMLEAMDEAIIDNELRECMDTKIAGYWLPTRDNAIRPLYSLLAFARMRPDGEWYIC